ncbi:class I SAM-dependent methyltransferase [Streptomyces pseudogriseolus]
MTTNLLTAAPSAEVRATDLNEAMLALGSTRVPGAMWRQADAQRLPFPNGGFDLVVCQFGVRLFPDRIQAFTEVRRVPAPGGRSLYLTGTPVRGRRGAQRRTGRPGHRRRREGGPSAPGIGHRSDDGVRLPCRGLNEGRARAEDAGTPAGCPPGATRPSEVTSVEKGTPR